MRRPRNRQRKVVANDQLVDLFRKALPAERWLRSGKRLTLEQHKAALAAIHALHDAAGVRLWEHGPLSPRATDGALQSALLAKLPAAELKAWQRYVDRWRKRCEKAEAREPEVAPRETDEASPRPDLRWSKSSGGW